MFEKEAEYYAKEKYSPNTDPFIIAVADDAFKDGAEFGYNKANERHSPEEHIDKDKVVLGIIKHCNKTRYSLVQWNGEWWYQYGTFNAEVRLIAWYNIPELKESEIKREIFPEITLPEESAEFVDKIIADAENRLKEIE